MGNERYLTTMFKKLKISSKDFNIPNKNINIPNKDFESKQ